MSDLTGTAEAWVSREEAIELTGLSMRSLYQRIAEESWRARPSSAIGRNGRPIPEIAVSSLPKAAQALYWSKHLVPAAAPESDPLNLAEIPEALRVEARRRLAILDQVEAILSGPRGLREEALDVFCRDRDLSPRTVYRWRSDYKRGGIGALLPEWGKTRGQFIALSTPLQSFIKDDYCSPANPSPTTVYEHVKTICAHLNEPLPSQATVNRFILTLPKPAVIMAREGLKAWRAKAEPKCHRDLNAARPNEWWCGDHRVFDVMVKTHSGEGRKIFRPWVTFWEDLRTATFVGRHVGLVPNSDTIALALRQGILRFGVPENLYIDNGKDYRCEYLNGKTVVSRNVQMSDDAKDTLAPGVLSPLGVSITHATAYQAWSKPIEPAFKHVFTEWERSLPGYCGPNAKEKPEKLKREIERDELLTLEQFVDRLDARIDAYHHEEHSRVGQAPIAAWQGVEIVRPNPRSLDLLLMRQKSVKVSHQGIRLHGRFYWHDELAMHIGHHVDVRFGEELGRVVVFAGGKFLCEALNDPALKMGATREDLAALQRRKQQARKRVTAYVEDRGVLMNEDRELARIAAESRARKVVSIVPTPPTPPGITAVPKMLPQLDHAAAQLAAASAQSMPSAPAYPQDSAVARRGRRSDAPPSSVTAAGARPVSAGRGRTGEMAARSAGDIEPEKDRYALLEELLG